MNFGDIVALARAGYKMSDIKELMDMKDPEPTPAPEPKPEPTPAPEPKPEPKPEPIDYKALYEKSQADLAAAQKANNNQNKEGTIPTNEETVTNWLSSFFE